MQVSFPMEARSVDPPLPSHVLVRLTVRTRTSLVPAVVNVVRVLAEMQGFEAREAGQVEVVAEEACLNAIQHAFGDDPDAQYTLSVERRPGQFVVAVEDQGLPFDWRRVEAGGGAGFGWLLIKAFTDEAAYINLGRGGKRLELIRNLPERRVEAGCAGTDTALEVSATTEVESVSDVPLEMRLLRSEEGVALARCFYRSYGYTYAEDIYYPERMREAIDQGLQYSFVAVTPDGEIVGHVAMVKRHPDSRVAEIGQAAVLPAFRGRKIFETLKELAGEFSRTHGIYGLYSESVTVHPFTQRANLKLGACETGILLAYAPDRLTFKHIEHTIRNRQTTVLFYLRVLEEPHRVVYPPPAHRSVIERIYGHAGLRRTVADAGPPAPFEDVPASLDVTIHPDFGLAFLTVVRCGCDLVDLVRVRLRQLCHNRMDCIYLDLPLAHSWTAHACSALETLGFSFAGVIPEMFDGDVLRLQFLNNVTVSPEEAVLASDFARDLFEYVLASRQQAVGGAP